MRLLDLFCGAGGCSMGYHMAGFEVVGVDIHSQPSYPFEFYRADALEFLEGNWGGFDAIHASPPCQCYSRCKHLTTRSHPDLVEPTRRVLVKTGLPYVIENVPGAPLRHPVMLCGSMFGMRMYRHRLFECSVDVPQPAHHTHIYPQTKMGRRSRPGEFLQMAGASGGNTALLRDITGLYWMSQKSMSQAIPPCFTRYVGFYLMGYLRGELE